MAVQMDENTMQMKRFSKQLENTDAVVFTVLGQTFLFSANTLTYFPITECAKDLLLTSDWENNFFNKSLLTKYSQKEIEKTIFKLKEFKKNKVISPIEKHQKGDIFYNDYYLKLVQSTRCNLNCSYCFAKKDKSYDMSVKTAKKAIQFFLDNFVPDDNRRFIIDLTGSGEPLLRLDFILEINDFVLKLKSERNINIFCQLATNGMLLTKEIGALLREKQILFGVSLDGEKEISEKNRTGLNYDLVAKNIEQLENKDFFGLAATYTGNNYGFIRIFKSLCLFKPEVAGMKPVRLPETNSSSINMNNIEKIKDSYDKFAKWLYKQVISGTNNYFQIFIKSEDYFARFLRITLRPIRLFYRCSAAINSFAVDSNENIIICPAFIGKEEGLLGNLSAGIDLKSKRKFENYYADKIIYCKNCWARYTCGGECFSVGFMSTGKLQKPAEAMCELKKYLIQLSIYFWTCLRYEHEEIYRNCIEKI